VKRVSKEVPFFFDQTGKLHHLKVTITDAEIELFALGEGETTNQQT